MKNFHESVETNRNPNRPYIPEHSYRILDIGGSGSGKTNVLPNLIKHQRPDIDKKFIYMSKIPLNQSINYLLMEREKSRNW